MNVARQAMQDTLEATFGQPQSGKLDLNNAGLNELSDRLPVPLQQAERATVGPAAPPTGRGFAELPQ